MIETPCEVPGCNEEGCYGIGLPVFPKDTWWCRSHKKEWEEAYTAATRQPVYKKLGLE